MAIRYNPFHASGSSVLPPNQAMVPGQYLMSQNGRFRLVLQVDGNLIITDNGAVVWIADGTQRYSQTTYPRKMREPLKFVISNNGFLYDPSRGRIWIAESTHTTDKSFWYNTCLTIQDDGNLVIFDMRTGDSRWARFGFEPGRSPKRRPLNIIIPGITIFNYEW